MMMERVMTPGVMTGVTWGLAGLGVVVLLVTGVSALGVVVSQGAVGQLVFLAVVWFALMGGMLAVLFFLLAMLVQLLAAHLRTATAQQEALRQMQVTTQFLEQTLRDGPAGAAGLLPAPLQVQGNGHGHGHVHPHGPEERAAELSRGQMLELLQRIHDAALMSDGQREQLAARHWRKRKVHLTEVIERQVLTGEFGAALGHAEELMLLLPGDGEVESLVERVKTEYALRLTEDVAAARAQLKQLMSVTAWQEAQELVISLERKYPGKGEVEALMREVVRERDKHEREAKERLITDIADASERRQWRRAAGAAEEFISRFPADAVAERLIIDMPTLLENAAAQDRKEQEQHFKELLKQHRYAEALGTARQVIEKHPQSTAAAELMKLVPRVEELLRQEQGVGTRV